MAPVAPLGRERAIQLVKQGKLPIWIGSPHPTVMIVEQEGLLRVRELVIDEAEARAASERALARGGSWMPEQYYALGRPTGTICVEAKTREQLLERLREMPWPESW